MHVSLPRIAIVGRPNVGKSTLFNRLVGNRKALVNDMPGVTRDRRYIPLQIGKDWVELIDTAGVEEDSKDDLARRLNDISRTAMAEAEAVVFVLDGIAGITPADLSLTQVVRKSGKPVIMVVNKADAKASQATMHDVYSLGFGDALPLSAEHGIGVGDLLDALAKYAKPKPEEDEIEALKLAIVGRPNAGKSTLVNQLVGEERMLTGPEAGLTRESISSFIKHGDQLIELIDTAGLRKKARISERVEKISASDSIGAIRMAHVVVLLLDATQPFENQDRVIAARTVAEGKPLVIALNKWDLIENPDEVMDEVKYLLGESFAQVKNPPVITLSALQGRGIKNLLPKVEELFALWTTKLGTSQLNRFLEDATTAHPPPLTKDHKSIRLKFIAQVTSRPPTFNIWCNRPDQVPESYKRYLLNGISKAFGLDGIIVRMRFSGGSKNPYV